MSPINQVRLHRQLRDNKYLVGHSEELHELRCPICNEPMDYYGVVSLGPQWAPRDLTKFICLNCFPYVELYMEPKYV